MEKKNLISRRDTLKSIGVIGASGLLGSTIAVGEDKAVANSSNAKVNPSDIAAAIREKVYQTTLIDTHEHLEEESERTASIGDFTRIMSMYLKHDMISAGMPQEQNERFFGGGLSPKEKWKILEPYWPAIKNTGYAQAVKRTIKTLYGVDELSGDTVDKVQAGYESLIRPGYYKHVLHKIANIESCQVQNLDMPYRQSQQPELLMQDIGIVFLYAAWNPEKYSKASGIKVQNLDDWHRVIDWWFDKYGKYAVACKSQDAYGRNINYRMINGDKAADIFLRKLKGETVSEDEINILKNHLFTKCVDRAVKLNLPIKLHSGYYAGNNNMPLSLVSQNPAGACAVCKNFPEAKFVFLHICYPYYEDIIAVAKHYTNAYVDMCWSWIINPLAAKDFLKKFLVTAPANKVFVFGGDYGPVEPVVGHAQMAREGTIAALTELVTEGYISVDEAMSLADMIMHENARKTYNLAEKYRILKSVPWKTA